ncbi:uncharacterized protein [Venturia canescens]|uniref:uncharacterized protein isoform X2 n=1 Tax=Venturia canescens TaxID=32260 RepID=UPI001C9D299A|nr:uncharacterized protein LOC122408880 isoform X2 [Venturia canescens]
MQKMQSVLKRAEERLRMKDQEITRLKRKKFLADYGLVWIGDTKTDRGKRQSNTPNDFIKNCYAQLTANIEELNLAVGKDEVYVELNQNGAGASFKTPTCMCLRFYKNGMVVEDGKLRPYNDPNTVSFIRDILDGYFPSELQKSYPNGVPFKVEDHRTETYLLGPMGFPGHGYRLGKQALMGKRPSSSTAKPPTTTNFNPTKSPYFSVDSQKKNTYSCKTGAPSVPSSARSSKQRICPPPLSVELLDLRSQILASHNNNCSHSHLQSHVNAELGIGNRTERKRFPAAKTTQYHMSVKEKSLTSKGSRTDSVSLSSRKGKASQHASVDRSSSGFSSSRMEKSFGRVKSRPRSASLNNARLPIRSCSRFSSPTGIDGSPRHINHATSGTTAKPRISKSATLDRKSELPTVREINQSSGKPGGFRLKVRSMNGSTVYLVHVSADDTVAKLYQLLDKALAKGRHRSYKIIISGYERKRLDQFGIQLKEYGISRDSVLHLVND